MTDPDSTSQVHYLILIRHLHARIQMLMEGALTGAQGLLELGAELKWLSNRAGVKA